MRRSVAEHRNPQLGNWSKWGRNRTNLTFFAEALRTMRKPEFAMGDGAYSIGLVGSRDLPGICLRRAQSILRLDRRPSPWSHAFIITEPWDGESPVGKLPIAEVPLFARNGEFPEPLHNGVIRTTTLGHYADRNIDANIGLFAVASLEKGERRPLGDANRSILAAAIADPNLDRDRYDFWESLAAWQRYFWSDERLPNPTAEGQPIASTSLIEMIYEQIGLDLTPAASERNSAPEHLWTSFRWWLQAEVQNQLDVGGHAVAGCYVLRDPGAAVLGPDERR